MTPCHRSTLLVVGLLSCLIGCNRSGENETSEALSTDGVASEVSDAAESAVDAVARLKRAAARGGVEASQVDRLIEQAALQSPSDEGVCVAAARVLAMQGRLADSSQWMHRAIEMSSSPSAALVQQAVSVDMQSGRLIEANQMLAELCKRLPDNHVFQRLYLGSCLEIGLDRQARLALFELIKLRKFDAPLLEANRGGKRNFVSLVSQKAIESNSDDFRLWLGPAADAIGGLEMERAAKMLQDILEHHPDFELAMPFLLLTLADQGKFSQAESLFGQWWSEGRKDLAYAPEYWIAAGLMHRQRSLDEGDPKRQQSHLNRALAAFAKAISIDPHHRQLSGRFVAAAGQWLQMSSERPELKSQRELVKQLVEAFSQHELLTGRLDEMVRRSRDAEHQDPGVALAVADRMLKLDRLNEAEAWSAIAYQLAAKQQEAGGKKKSLVSKSVDAFRSGKLARRLSATSKELQDAGPIRELARRYLEAASFFETELASWWAMDDGIGKTALASRFGPESLGTSAKISLVQVNDSYQLRHRSDVGEIRKGPTVPVAFGYGSGAGVLDFDLDGCMDVYLGAAGELPRVGNNPTNRLYRRLSEPNRFRDSSEAAELIEDGFAQGICVGDYNDDGWPDIWVLNFGINRLYRNQGDGTFDDVTEDVGLENSEVHWSTSGAMADINHDGITDLLAIRYIDASEDVEKDCFANGKKQLCNLSEFRAAANELLVGDGNGVFIDQSRKFNQSWPAGRSLALVVGRLDGDNLGVVIANDFMANEMIDFGPLDLADGDNEIQAEHRGLLAGVAMLESGKAQASMGLGWGDWNQDRKLDFYMSGFSNEWDALYEQKSSGIWRDVVPRTNLATLTFNRLGFGSKFCDFDGDGIDEIVVSNGHISEMETSALPMAQLPDLFRWSSDNGWYREQSDDGGYLDQPHVGRTLVTADFNDDLRPDVLVTHLIEEVALLENRTDSENRFVGLELIATRGSRDAVGAMVDYSVAVPGEEERSVRRVHRVSGFGYFGSSDPVIRFGVGAADYVSDVVVHWNDGSIQELGELKTGLQYLVVQGQQLVTR
ncbi:MAG: FG-GAP-like repeat-containing protein [Planctomycetota bacterium]